MVWFGLKCESASRCFQPGEGPSRGLLLDCTTSPINRFAALIVIILCSHHAEEGGVPVEPEDLYQGEGHVERDEEEVGDAED